MPEERFSMSVIEVENEWIYSFGGALYIPIDNYMAVSRLRVGALKAGSHD